MIRKSDTSRQNKHERFLVIVLTFVLVLMLPAIPLRAIAIDSASASAFAAPASSQADEQDDVSDVGPESVGVASTAGPGTFAIKGRSPAVGMVDAIGISFERVMPASPNRVLQKTFGLSDLCVFSLPETGVSVGESGRATPLYSSWNAEIDRFFSGIADMYGQYGSQSVFIYRSLPARSLQSMPDSGGCYGFLAVLAMLAVAALPSFAPVLQQGFKRARLAKACGCRSP